MHTGPIELPDAVREDCFAVINLADILQMFTINQHIRAMEVFQKLLTNKVSILDLQDLRRLASALADHEQTSVELRVNIECLSEALELFINVSATPSRPCGAWVTRID